MLFAWITDPNAWLALGTLTLLEIVLGIDNIIFLSLVVAKLPTAQRAHARRLGLAGAMVMRLALLASIAWVTRLTNPLFTIFSQEISARDLILLLGGLFLIWKASKEIHESIEGEEEGLENTRFIIPRRYRTDYAAGYYLQPRFSDYRCGSVRSPVYYDGSRGNCRRRDDVRCAFDW